MATQPIRAIANILALSIGQATSEMHELISRFPNAVKELTDRSHTDSKHLLIRIPARSLEQKLLRLLEREVVELGLL